jgi:hypothetical protein
MPESPESSSAVKSAPSPWSDAERKEWAAGIPGQTFSPPLRTERISLVKAELLNLVDSGLVEQIQAADKARDAKILLRAAMVGIFLTFAGTAPAPRPASGQ